MTSISDLDVDRWLAAFAECVRTRDLDGGRALFSADATGFGTVAENYRGLDELVNTQWADVWSRTEGFEFDDAGHRWLDASLCAVAATWRSTGTDDDRRTRTGRATLVLRREGDRLLAVHSHFSMTPGTRS